MQTIQAIRRTFSVKLVSITLLFVIISVLFSSAFFYSNMDRTVGDTYDQKIRMVSLYKFEIVKQSLFIFGGFAILAFFGIAVMGVLHTHKIVGPLVRTRMVARQFADGQFDVVVKFREGDAIQPIADSLNQFAKTYRGRYALMHDSIHEMYKDAEQMRDLFQTGDVEGAYAARARIVERTKEVNGMLSEIKL